MKYSYPLVMRSRLEPSVVVEFLTLKSGRVLESNYEPVRVGEVGTDFIAHTDTSAWELYSSPDKPQDASDNNGGKTDYYQLDHAPFPINDFDDFAEWRGLNGNQFNIGKAVWAFNIGRHSGTDYLRDLNKIIHYANREKLRLSREAQNVDK